MNLSKTSTPSGSRWLLDGALLPESFSLSALLALPAAQIAPHLASAVSAEKASGTAQPPIDPHQEVWASGVTYLRSRDARKAESSVADVYQKVYEAERPELFMKSTGWRARTNGDAAHIRADSTWNVPEPELVIVINAHGEIVGYTAGNDMSSRDIEGENPLYLPQAKVYNGSCILGSKIVLAPASAMSDLAVSLQIARGAGEVFTGETNINRMKRGLQELVTYLYRELAFPAGAFLMTGTGVVPPESFTLHKGDIVRIRVGEVSLENPID